ncbi:MAG: hypothetical protein QNJ81_00175 [Acidimicrobiia bacterium]|nr:hypothetical protein [Acidimicrobiia bacterium]
MTAGDPFAGVVRQRSQLGQAMIQVEVAAAAPAAKESWMIDLLHSLRQLEIAFNNHIVEVQSPLGLLDRIVDQAPRLQRAVEATRDEHEAIAESIGAALAMMESEGAADRRDELRDTVMGVLLALARHRQKGADLIYEAYDVDIGGY